MMPSPMVEGSPMLLRPRACMAALRFALAVFLPACVISATAPAPSPNLPTASPATQSATIKVVDVPEEKVCSQHGGLKDFCVSGLQDAVRSGLARVVSNFYVAAAAGGPDYTAEFKMLEFSHSPVSGGDKIVAVKVSMRWSFVLKDKNGAAVVSLAETTDGPEQLVNVGAADKTVGSLLNAVLERVASGIGANRAVAANVASAAPPGKACVRGVTQACLGPGACKGAQNCLPDGSGYDRCDCGPSAAK
jgi:hypothetical protein